MTIGFIVEAVVVALLVMGGAFAFVGILSDRKWRRTFLGGFFKSIFGPWE